LVALGFEPRALTCDKQVLEHSSHTLSLTSFSHWPGASSYTSSLDAVTSVNHHAWLVCWDWGGGLTNFCRGWPWTTILQIFTSQVTEITGMHHHTWPVITVSSSPLSVRVLLVLLHSCLFILFSPEIKIHSYAHSQILDCRICLHIAH
jgi:hypothetical protein